MKTESGRSMIEMLAVLAIIGVITVSALSGYSQAMLRYKTNKTVTEVVTIADEVFKLYSWRRGYPLDAVDCALLKKEGILEQDNCATPFGGTYTIRGNASAEFVQGEGDNKYSKCLDIEINNLPNDACIQIQDEIWSGIKLCNTPSCTGTSITISVE